MEEWSFWKYSYFSKASKQILSTLYINFRYLYVFQGGKHNCLIGKCRHKLWKLISSLLHLGEYADSGGV